MMSGQEVLNKIRQDESYFNVIYREHRNYTLNYFSRNWSSVDEDTLTDIYQNAVVVLLEKSRDPNFKLTCNVQTYLNSVCRNQLLNKKKSGDSMMNNTDEFDENITDWHESFDNVREERLSLIENKLNQLKDDGGKCYELHRKTHTERHTQKVTYRKTHIERHTHTHCMTLGYYTTSKA